MVTTVNPGISDLLAFKNKGWTVRVPGLQHAHSILVAEAFARPMQTFAVTPERTESKPLKITIYAGCISVSVEHSPRHLL